MSEFISMSRITESVCHRILLKKIYDSYSRADEARIHKTEGAGLGMAITKYIVDAMEGSIEVQSEIDRRN